MCVYKQIIAYTPTHWLMMHIFFYYCDIDDERNSNSGFYAHSLKKKKTIHNSF